MKFSVIIPCFNAEDTISDALQSCLAQGPVVERILAVDDHSTDCTPSILKEWAESHPQIQVLANPKKGAPSARNLGMKHSTTELIQWLDADDTLGAGKLYVAQKFHLSNPNQLLACPWHSFPKDQSNQQHLNINTRWINVPNFSTPSDWISEDRHMVPHCYSGHRRLFEQVEPWDESLLINQDGEYISRVIAASEGVTFTREIEVGYRQSSGKSVSRFSPEKADSLFRSTESMERTALSLEDSHRMRQMVANRWQHFIYTAYPSRPDLIQAAQSKLQSLPAPNISNPNAVSPLSKLFSRTLGWKTLTQARLLRSKLTAS
ncbi:MAG: glycosyltransferase family 2 protein [Alphaproteobacteria bacterium TMED89]|nr:MAG: glycosyltransferase family 2 protein [Alphaproteobacteria bacterium TMED89]